MDSRLTKYSKYSILAMLFGTLITVPFYEGYSYQLVSGVKIMLGLCLYASLVFAILSQTAEHWAQMKLAARVGNVIFTILGFVSILRGIFYPSAYLVGDLYLTLFFNPVFAPMFFFPAYMFLGNEVSIKALRNGSIWISLLIIFFYLGGVYPDLRIILLLCLLFPIMSNTQRVVFAIITSFCLYCNFIEIDLYLGATRRYLIVLSFFVLSYILVYIVQKKWLNVAVAIIIAISPFSISLSMSDKAQSAFEKIQEYWPFSEKENINLRNTDTRTFLYEEMALDLSNNHAWMWGKGAYSSYYSYFFSHSSADAQNRANSEVTFLQYTLRAGLTFSIFLAFFFIYAGVNAVFRSENKWIRFLGLNILGFYIAYFVADFNFFDFIMVGFWICVGLCLNKTWLSKSDAEINNIFKQKHLAESYERFLRRKEKERKLRR